MDVLTQDRLQVFYPSELERQVVSGPWQAALMVGVDASIVSSVPFLHPYYAHTHRADSGALPTPPWKFVPLVRSRVLVLPPAPREYFSFRLRPLFERIIRDHDVSLTSTPVNSSTLPPPVRWTVGLHDIEVKGKFCEQFVDTLHMMPMIRSLSFLRKRTLPLWVCARACACVCVRMRGSVPCLDTVAA